MSFPFPQNRIQQERAQWESGGENFGNLIAAILKMIQQNQMKSEATDQFGSAVSGATRTSYNPTPSNIQQGQEFGDVMRRGTIEAGPRDTGGVVGQDNVSANPYARTDSLDNNALMRSLAQMLGQTQNPALKEQIGGYFAGQKAVQGLQPPQPEYGFMNTPVGLYRTNKQSGGADLVSGTQPPMIKPSFKTDNVTVDENGKPMQYRIVTDEHGNEVRREKIGPSYQKPEKTNDASGVELRIRTLEDDIEKAEREVQEAELKMSALESGADPVLKYDRNNPTSSGYQMFNVLGSNRLANLKKIERKRKELEALQSGATFKRPIGPAGGSEKPPTNKQPATEYDYVPGKGLVPRAR